MGRLVPEGTPDPERDRLFADPPFPLLEPVGWTGERRRGEYGTHESRTGSGAWTSEVSSLGLVFGPRDFRDDGPRIAIDVGRGFVRSVAAPMAGFLLGRRLGFDNAEQRQAATAGGRELPVAPVVLAIDAEDVTFAMVRHDRWWIAQGRWAGHAVELHVTDVEPHAIALRRATRIPAR